MVYSIYLQVFQYCIIAIYAVWEEEISRYYTGSLDSRLLNRDLDSYQ